VHRQQDERQANDGGYYHDTRVPDLGEASLALAHVHLLVPNLVYLPPAWPVVGASVSPTCTRITAKR
jgi:hypothetical protein